MNLGAFSVSLAVKDLSASQAFYEALGFSAFAGDPAQNHLILKNSDTVIGLFQGMFDGNILTFNPRWTQSAQPTDGPDIRNISAAAKAAGLTPSQEIDPNSTGPASFMLTDPDGNTILIDQHV